MQVAERLGRDLAWAQQADTEEIRLWLAKWRVDAEESGKPASTQDLTHRALALYGTTKHASSGPHP